MIIARGHADEDGGASSKAARLLWKPVMNLGISVAKSACDSRDRERLMCSGGNTRWDNPGVQIIKGEWDKVEAWLLDHVDSPTP